MWKLNSTRVDEHHHTTAVHLSQQRLEPLVAEAAARTIGELWNTVRHALP